MKLLHTIFLVPPPLPTIRQTMALNYNRIKNIRTLWIHRLTGTDFLVRAEHETLARLAEAITGERGRYVEDGSFECNSDNLQTVIYDDGFEPGKEFYQTIAYVERHDAYKMTMTNQEPEEYFKELQLTSEEEDTEYPLNFMWPEDLVMIEREAPYDFTRKIPSEEEFDFNFILWRSEHELLEQIASDDDSHYPSDNEERTCSFCHEHMHSCREGGDHSSEMRDIIRHLRKKDRT